MNFVEILTFKFSVESKVLVFKTIFESDDLLVLI